ncbi:hypothetical protein L1049_006306 [Liquidambar formosana]|uniref:GDT1 family protein n=1 Tax=Liquidambar formosana TaxID=63359 RepID=A0AAP0RH08_LIQFO
MKQGFAKSIAMTILSEIGDNTFIATAILAMRYPRRLVLSGCLASLIDADLKANAGKTKEGGKADDELKKQRRPILTQFFSPIFLKAFSITFFGEWGDKSQLATISLAADENPLGVVLGGIIGQALCTAAAVLGGKSLASKISERILALSGGVLFIVFGIHSFLSPVKP